MADRKTIAKEALAGRENFLYAKNDGSLSDGIEFVSHPFSADWLQSNREVFSDFYDVVAKRFDMRPLDSCGIHIHTSKLGYAVSPESIPGCQGKDLPVERLISRGILRTQKFVYGHPSLMRHFAGRSNDRYASLSSGPSSSSPANEMIKLSRELGEEKRSRYTGLNITKNTLEYRIFRSTISLEELMRDIMFVDSIVKFVRHTAVPKTGAPSLKLYRALLASDPNYSDVLSHYDAWASSAKFEDKQVNFISTPDPQTIRARAR